MDPSFTIQLEPIGGTLPWVSHTDLRDCRFGVCRSFGRIGCPDAGRSRQKVRRSAQGGQERDPKVYTNIDAGNTPAAAVLPAGPDAKPNETPRARDRPEAAHGRGEEVRRRIRRIRLKGSRRSRRSSNETRSSRRGASRRRSTACRPTSSIGQSGARAGDRGRIEVARSPNWTGCQKAIEDGKKAIADFEEEARRAGVPAGWLR